MKIFMVCFLRQAMSEAVFPFRGGGALSLHNVHAPLSYPRESESMVVLLGQAFLGVFLKPGNL